MGTLAKIDLGLLGLVSVSAALLVSCKNTSTEEQPNTASCKGVTYSRSSVDGSLMKYNETFNSSLGHCLSRPIEITNFEKTLDERQRKNIKCSPQPSLPSMTLKASGNFYSARDDHYYIDLNADTGEYRMLSTGTFYDGKPVIERRLGCYYVRTDVETEPINPRNYGAMIMFGQEGAAMTDPTGYDEIFNYTNTGAGFEMVDPSPSYRQDWTYEFCPYQSVPMGFCDLLKNGNIMYLPSLDVTQQAALLNEAILIRTTYSFVKVSRSELDTLWQSYDGKIGTSRDEGAAILDEYYSSQWKHRIAFATDPNPYTADAWIKYLKREQQYMPDLGSPSLLPVCYDGKRDVILDDGSTATVYGQICYIQGEYEFTEQ